MNRRGFLRLFASVAAGAVLDPERLLWAPGAKLISIPVAPMISIPVAPIHLSAFEWTYTHAQYGLGFRVTKAAVDRHFETVAAELGLAARRYEESLVLEAFA